MTIIAASELEPGTRLRAQVCVLGGGAAGISLVRQLAASGVDSLLVESGGEEFDPEVQALYEGRADGYFDLTTTRLRYLGGTTNHYAGQSRPFETIDFEAQPWRAGEGWPIDHEELRAHLAGAVEVLGLAEDRWDTPSWFPDLAEPVDPALGVKVFQAVARPLGAAYRDELEASDRITVVLGANATRLRLAEGNAAIDHVQLRTLSGTPLEAEADVYVVATGGIESARLLLASNDEVPDGVGNGSGLVGRYFADHPAVGSLHVVPGPAGPALPRDTIDNPATELGVQIVTTISITEEAQRELELPGFHAFVLANEAPPADELTASGVEGLLNIGGEAADVARSVVIGFESVPDAQSRVTLDTERDALGEPRAVVDWRLSDDDERNMATTIELVARELATTGVGRMRLDPEGASWREVATGQHHHMGTLRMSASPSTGVVDTDLRFHDVSNLFALGSAVFPTYGHVNPTLNIVALGLRLAEHLRNEVS